jgi:hypothetical protein
MAYYNIEPEVSGQLGEKTIIDTSVHPSHVEYLHFVFCGWLGDDIIECFPVFLITGKLKSKLESIDLTGYKIDNCEIELSEEFKLMQPNVQLPNFYWFKLTEEEHNDFFISENKLKVSETAYTVLSQVNLQHAIIEISDNIS